MNIEDLDTEISVNYKQIIALIDLMMECDNSSPENLLTLRDLAEEGEQKNNVRIEYKKSTD